jgi:hypothetical protein
MIRRKLHKEGPMPNVPVDRRPQFSGLAAIMANTSMGRMPFAGMQQIAPDRYVVAGAWPTPKVSSFSSSVAASPAEPAAPKTAASALWPNLLAA